MAWFLPVLVSGRKVSGHGNLSLQYQVPIDGRKLSGHDEAVLTVPSPGKDCEFLVMMK